VKPKVSVVIPAYNAESYLAETLQSVFAQSYSDYEVIVVDDGSNDGTRQVMESFKPRIKALRKANGGPASARNLAIDKSAGEYIAFLDSDDLWVEEKLQMQVEFLDANPDVGLVYGEALMFSGDGDDKRIEGRIGYTGDPSFRLLLYGDFIPNSTVVIRRACVEKVGLLNESRELVAVEDYEYWMRIARSFPIAAISKPLTYYRLRDGNLMGNGRDIDKGLTLSVAALRAMERLHPNVWNEQNVNREQLFARLHVRAAFAWKRRRDWIAMIRFFFKALKYNAHPRVFRWILAAMLLKRWS
jgi:glycosyltransferase involved in cell wall biosynthesis